MYGVDYALPPSSINLQTNLCSATATTDTIPKGHHPITCRSDLRFEDDGEFACEHYAAEPGDARTQMCVDHSIAVLLFELLREREGP